MAAYHSTPGSVTRPVEIESTLNVDQPQRISRDSCVTLCYTRQILLDLPFPFLQKCP